MSADTPEATPPPVQDAAPATPVDVAHTKKRFVFRILLLVLTLALWKGWAEENHFLDVKIAQENQALQADGSNSFTSPMPSFTQHVVAVNERENRYRERESGQPFKLIPMVLWTLFAGWLAIAPQAKEKLDITLETLNTVPKAGMRIITLVACVVAVFGAWMICGHAATGAFAALVVGGYLYWLGRQQTAKES